MKVLILGSGSLVRNICYALSSAGPQGMQIHVASRSESDVAEIVAVSSIRAAQSRSGLTFTGSSIQWSDDSLPQLLQDIQPSFVVHAASLVSPWEQRNPQSRWSQLLSRCGFGLTLPLQAVLALKTVRAIQQSAADCQLINASYPDGVNPLLAALGLPVLCGVGNIAILAAAYEACIPAGVRFSMIAHHSDIGRIGATDRQRTDHIRVWLDDVETNESDPTFLKLMRQIRGAELNQVTGATVVSLLARLTSHGEFRCHLPGPNGLPGGYPVRFRSGRVFLDLPAGFSQSEAIAHNQEAGDREGVSVSRTGIVQFSEIAATALSELAPQIPASFPASEIDQVADQFIWLKGQS
jgi:hypothetical protein